MKVKILTKTKWAWQRKSPDVKVDMHINLGRVEKDFEKAQYYLDSMIMTHMEPFMPLVTGGFIQRTKALSASFAGSGIVFAAAPPYGRFLYEGKTMVSESTGSTWAKLGERKVLVSKYEGRTRAKENLSYNTTFHPEVTSKWFEAAKARYKSNWVRVAKQKAGGG